MPVPAPTTDPAGPARPPRRRRPTPRQVRWAGSALFVALGWLWALSTPLMASPDEPGHAIRAAEVARLEVLGRQERTTTPTGDERVDTYATVPRGYADLHAVPACHAFQGDVPAGCSPAVGTAGELTEVHTGAGAYPPLYYAVVGWPSRLLEPHDALFAMRALSAAIGGILLGWALAAAYAAADRGWTTIGVGLAATPMALFLLGSINPNGVEVAAGLATWATALDLVAAGPGRASGQLGRFGRWRPTTGQVVRVAVAAGVLATLRPLGPAYLAGISLAVVALAATRQRLADLIADGRARWGAAAVAATCALTAAWVVWSGSQGSLIPSSGGVAPGRGEAVRRAAELTTDRLVQMVGTFGWLDTPAPWGLTTLWLVGVAALAVVAVVVGSPRERLVVVATTAAAVLLPIAYEGLTATRQGHIWQGRYTLPLAVGVPLVAAWVVARRGRPPAVLAVGAVVAAGGVAVGQLAGWATVASRYVAGTSRGLLGFLDGDGWTPPLPLAVLALGAVALSAALGLALWWTATGQVDEADPGRAPSAELAGAAPTP